ncbi:ABC transporter permease [Actinomyces johnsonii]|uniref:ABC transporter permease n=1 Tax=Actinomyces johnsonii TaxID=544581 RepID=A0A508A5R4_9ACTO|nr:ABC transporter permease [Actinomyces johnsonii]KAA8744182.1 ABC transporter permease [Actinomyces johnsonii]TQD43774.1 ABC transporter permease [Actinomyces johnsonii]
MTAHTIQAVLRAACRQAAADLRAGLVGTSIALLASVSAIVLASRSTQATAEAHATFGPMFLASSIGTISCFITFQIASETYSDRIGGALLRVRILPHGPLTWAIGKTMSSITQTVAFQGAILLGGALFVEALPLSPPQVLACLPLMVLSAVATAPLGFLVGTFVRGVYSFMVSYLPIFALVGTSGFFMPMDRLPFWVQAVQLALPTYWSGHLTRWALVGDPSWEVGRAFSPALAVGVLAAWTVLGFAGASFVVRHSFRKETIGTLARMQSTIRSQTGL